MEGKFRRFYQGASVSPVKVTVDMEATVKLAVVKH